VVQHGSVALPASEDMSVNFLLHDSHSYVLSYLIKTQAHVFNGSANG
jgi:hypothetical protein